MKKILVILMCTFAVHVQAQEGVAINNDGASPDASSILDLKSTTKGILIPRMTESQRTQISNGATGLLVFQTDGTSGFYFYSGSGWESLSTKSNTMDEAYDEGGAGSGRIITADAGTVVINGTGGLLVDANTTTLSNAAQINNTDGTNSTETYIGKVGVLSNEVVVQGVYGEAKLTSATQIYDGGFGVFGTVKHPSNGTVNLNATAASASASINKAVGVGGEIGPFSDYIGGPADIIASVYGGTELHNSNGGSVYGGAKLYAGLFQGNGRTLGLWGENSTYMELIPRWQLQDYDAGVIGFYNSDPDGGNNDSDVGTSDDYLSIEANVTDGTVKHVVLQNRTSGNVGIGHSSPFFKLDVNGEIYTDEHMMALGGIHVGGTADPGTDNLVVDGNTTVVGTLTTGTVTYPNTDGTPGQVMTTDGAGVVSFQAPSFSAQDLTLLGGNTLWLTNDATTVDLSPFLDNTDNQDLTLTGNTLSLTNDATTVDLSAYQSNTLDEAYDEGGAGVGRQIDASDGAVRVNGDDGFIVTGTYGSGDLIEVSGAGTRMFFNPNKAAFRAGGVTVTEWDNANVGAYSTAMGNSTTASGETSTAMGNSTTASGYISTAMGNSTTASGNVSTAMGSNTTASGVYSTAMGIQTSAFGYSSTAMGYNTTASGNYSTAMGANTSAPSGFETAIGRYNTNYTPASTITWNSADRLFVVGNGTGVGAESNALTIYKDGKMNINDAYDMPTADGTAGQVLTTNGSGVLSFQLPSDNQDLSLSGNTLSLTNDATTVDLSGYMDNTDDWTNSGNNIYYNNGSVGIGTSSPNSKLNVNSPSTATGAHFRVQDNSNTKFCVANNGYTALYYNDAPSYNLQLNVNSAAKPTSSSWIVSSDARLKTNVSPFSDGLNVLMAINPVWFQYNGKAGMPTNERGVGTIAQELQKIAPYMVNEWTFTEGSLDESTARPTGPRVTTNYLGVDYGAMDFIVINSIQEQQSIIESQKAEIDELKAQMIEMQAAIKTLTNKK